MNKKLIAIIAITVIIISTIIVTFFGAKAAAGDFNTKVKEIKVFGHFDDDVKKEYAGDEQGVIIIEIKKNAQYFQFACEVVPSDATYPKLIYISNNISYFDVDDNGLVKIKAQNKSGEITIVNSDSGIRVIVRFVIQGKDDGTIGELPW